MQQQHDAFHGIRQMTAILSFALLALHSYYYCYAAFAAWGWTAPVVDGLARNLAHSGVLQNQLGSKTIIWLLLAVSLLGKDSAPKKPAKKALVKQIVAGLLLYFGSGCLLLLPASPTLRGVLFMAATGTGLFFLYGLTQIATGWLQGRIRPDVFNRLNEQFPQEERVIDNPYTIHLKGQYRYKNQLRNNVINLEIFRGTMIVGVPGSGKTRHIFREMIRQSIANGMCMFVFDLKYDDLTRLTYHLLEKYRPTLATKPTFYSINFDDLDRSHRCNVLQLDTIADTSDAAEYARTLLYATNKRWIAQQGDFFIESAVAFVTAVIWFLRQIDNGRCCTLPHAIEIMQLDFLQLFSALRSVPGSDTLIDPFISALNSGAMNQLQGQIDSARIALAGLASPRIYYVLSGNDFDLDINNPAKPKVVCLASNTQKQHVYGAVISLYVTRLFKLVNKKGCLPCHIPLDELSSFYAHGLHATLAQARQNRVAVTLGIQDLSQLRMEYGRDQADALFNLPANFICGQAFGDTARLASERLGKILQSKQTVTTNSRDSSSSQGQHLDLAVPPSKISGLSAGEFVGLTGDTPAKPIELKGFHCHILVDNEAIGKEDAAFTPIPIVHHVTPEMLESTTLQIKMAVKNIVEKRLAYMRTQPELAILIVTKKRDSGGPHQAL